MGILTENKLDILRKSSPEETICMTLETICMKCQSLFSGKNKKNISKYHLLKFLPREVIVDNRRNSVKVSTGWIWLSAFIR